MLKAEKIEQSFVITNTTAGFYQIYKKLKDIQKHLEYNGIKSLRKLARDPLHLDTFGYLVTIDMEKK